MQLRGRHQHIALRAAHEQKIQYELRTRQLTQFNFLTAVKQNNFKIP